MPAKIIHLVKECNSKNICKVKYGKQISESFEVTTRRRQSDALSPTLFNLALEKIVRSIVVSQEMDLLGDITPFCERYYSYWYDTYRNHYQNSRPYPSS